MENGANIVQAKRNDPRVTRIGAYLRKYSIDELPQLIKCAQGRYVDRRADGRMRSRMTSAMSNVSIAMRGASNVKPGITGWAQVHGHRGEIHDDSRDAGPARLTTSTMSTTVRSGSTSRSSR